MNQEGLIHAFIFDGAGGARQIGWNEIRSWMAMLGARKNGRSYRLPE